MKCHCRKCSPIGILEYFSPLLNLIISLHYEMRRKDSKTNHTWFKSLVEQFSDVKQWRSEAIKYNVCFIKIKEYYLLSSFKYGWIISSDRPTFRLSKSIADPKPQHVWCMCVRTSNCPSVVSPPWIQGFSIYFFCSGCELAVHCWVQMSDQLRRCVALKNKGQCHRGQKSLTTSIPLHAYSCNMVQMFTIMRDDVQGS